MKMVLVFDSEDADACNISFKLATKFMLESFPYTQNSGRYLTTTKIDIVKMMRLLCTENGVKIGLKETVEFYDKEWKKFLNPLYEGGR